MSTYRRSNTAGGSYFFTVVTQQRRPFLCAPDVLAALRCAIQHTRQTLPFTIDAWVVLPDHMHAIWTLQQGEANFGKRWGVIKSQVTKACRGQVEALAKTSEIQSESQENQHESALWQRRFWEHQIRDETDFTQHMNYVHFNPLKHGLVQRVRDWPHSTFHRSVKQEVYAQDWGLDADLPDHEFGE